MNLSLSIDNSLLLTLAAILVSFGLVFLNGFFVAAEFAIVKVRRTRLEELAGQGVAQARVSLRCVDQLDESLSATQLGITLVSLALGWLGEHAFASLLAHLAPSFASGGAHHVVAVVVAFGIITVLHVVLGELVPKSMAIQEAEKVTLWVARPLSLFYRFSRPAIRTFTAMANFILRRLGYFGLEDEPLTENELKLVMKESHEDGVISESEAQIINRAFEFSDRRVRELMVHGDKVDFISLAKPLDQNLAVVRRHMHTRFPLCREGFDTVIGVVHMKDAWPLLLTNFSNETFEKMARPAIFVDPALRQDQLLKIFQNRRGHLAIVADPRTKQNVGIITMEDVLECLVGEIRDEHGN
ncbi:MAG TPA: hemolysin family protein [Oligoflexia bacterium]|nr:hemolysin family protein [Oligoflexia bacterium]